MSYKHKHKHIGFNGGEQPHTSDLVEEFDSKEDFLEINKRRTIGLANLDGAMNFCAYFKRDKGNVGRYERDGKSHIANGEWDRYYILAKYNQSHTRTLTEKWYDGLLSFQLFLKENGWFNDDYFKLMDRYL